MEPIKAISRFLDTAGDGSGTKNANGNYASAADDFYFTAKRKCEIHRLIIEIEDTKGMEPDLKSWTNTTNETVLARFTFAKLGGPIELDKGESVGVTFNDDLSGLIEHYFLIQGQFL